jgi:non-canonical purine NTP pyrophosphatase (RdgB/HAM1 family)
MTDIIFITGNQHKADFLAKHLGVPIAHHKLDLDEIQSLDPREVVEHKVRQAYDVLQRPVLVEDAGLIFVAMGRLPGTFVKWFIEEIGYDGLLRMANALPESELPLDGFAMGCTMAGIYTFLTAKCVDGLPPEIQEGEQGFGFDPIFINDGFRCQSGSYERSGLCDRTSYRTDALTKLRDYLTSSLSYAYAYR